MNRKIEHPVSVSEKRCTKCGLTKPAEEFHRNRRRKKDGLQDRCKTCQRGDNLDHPPTPKNPTYFRAFKLQLKYGMSEKGYDGLLAKQEGKCAICGGSDRLVVDHDHATGAIRGLLCHGCNAGLGFLERREWMQRARRYLARAAGFHFCPRCGGLVLGRADKKFCSIACKQSVGERARRRKRWAQK